MKNKIFSVFLPFSGCKQRCLFCDQPNISGAEMPTPQEVAQNVLDSPEVFDELAFYGGSFTALPQAVFRSYLEIGKTLIEKGKIHGIRISTRPDAINENILKSLINHGVTTIELGVQSFDDTVLAKNRRPHDSAQIFHAVHWIRQFPLQLGLQMLPGLLDASLASDRISWQKALSLKPDFLRLYPLVIFENTALATLYREGHFRLHSFEEMIALSADFVQLAQQAEIPIIKLGLQVSRPQAIVAGYYHPNFSQLVYSHIWKNIFFRLQIPSNNDMLLVAASQFNNAIGFRKENLHFLERRARRKIAIKTDNSLRNFDYRFSRNA